MAGVAIAASAPASDLTDFLAAVEADDIKAVNRVYGKRLEALIAAKQKRDPLLDRMAGEMALRGGSPGLAAAFLEQAKAGATPADLAETSLAIARAQEALGRFDEAIRGYRGLLSVAEPVGRAARVGLARILLARDPDAAAKLLSEALAADGGAGDRWEAEILASRAAALSGRASEATKLLNDAWRDAPAARLEDAAIVRTTQDMAQDLFVGGDRARAIALARFTSAPGSLTGDLQLPKCGTGGITPEDWAVIEIAASPYGLRYSAVRTSRPGIAQPFVDAALHRYRGIEPARPLFLELRCSAAPAPELAATTERSRSDQWFVSNAIYPIFPDMSEGIDAAILESEAIVARHEAQGGATSLTMFGPLGSLAQLYLGKAFMSGNNGYLERAREIFRRQLSIAAAGDAPAALQQTIRLYADQPGGAGGITDPAAELSRLAASPDTTASDIAGYATGFLQARDASATPLPVARRIAVGERALTLLKERKAPATGPEMRAVSFALLASLREAGELSRLAAVAKAAQLDRDDCGVLANPPTGSQASVALIGPDQYPKDALRAEIEGMVKFETAVDASGSAVAPRVVAAYPPFVFDEATLGGARQFRFEPTGDTTTITPCRGMTQRVRWQIPQGYMPSGGIDPEAEPAS